MITKEELDEAIEFCETPEDIVRFFSEYLFQNSPKMETSLFDMLNDLEYFERYTELNCEFKRTGYSWGNDRVKQWLTKAGFQNKHYVTIKGLYVLLKHLQSLPTK
jgi:hypothetical protein